MSSPIMKFLLNCPLIKAFTICPSVVYHNFLREFRSTAVAYNPFPLTDETEQCPLREFLFFFLVLNGQRPLTLDFNTFCSSTGLDYNNGKYVAHPIPEAVKKELGKIAINPSYLNKTPVLKNSFLVAWRIQFTFVIQVLGGNYSSTEQVNLIQQLFAYCLIIGTQVDIGEIIYSDLVTKLLNKSRLKYVSYPRFISCALQVLLGSNYTQDEKFGYLHDILSNSNFTKDLSKVTGVELTAHMIAVNNQRDSVSPLPLSAKPKKGKSQTVTLTLAKSQGLEASGALSKKRQKPNLLGTVPDLQDLERNIQLVSIGFPSTLDEGTRKSQPFPEGTATHPKDSRGNIQPLDRDLTSTNSDEGIPKTTLRTGAKYQDELDKESDKEEVLAAREDIDEDPEVAEEVRTPSPKQDQPEPSHVQEYTFDSSSPDLKKFDNILPLTERQLIKYLKKMSKASIEEYYDKNVAHRDQTDKLLLKDINTAVKDDPAINKKIDEAIETFSKISTNTTEVLSLVKDFDFSTLESTVKDLQAHALKQEEVSAT
ncbi:hypothetical protein Tco_0941017 [Tanacetum coccineum]|uniref:Uncharacterized protein n=1 Tax=Tanacetum coccineum TaxID=301880 RepID=A0ABQ5DQB2_9ASTR